MCKISRLSTFQNWNSYFDFLAFNVTNEFSLEIHWHTR